MLRNIPPLTCTRLGCFWLILAICRFSTQKSECKVVRNLCHIYANNSCQYWQIPISVFQIPKQIRFSDTIWCCNAVYGRFSTRYAKYIILGLSFGLAHFRSYRLAWIPRPNYRYELHRSRALILTRSYYTGTALAADAIRVIGGRITSWTIKLN